MQTLLAIGNETITSSYIDRAGAGKPQVVKLSANFPASLNGKRSLTF